MSIGIPKGGVPGELVQKPAASSSAEKAAQDLEAFFVRQMLAELRQSSDNPLFGGGYAGKMFQEMLDERMAEQMSKAGGLGIADLVAQDLQEHEQATQLGLQMPGGPELATRSALRRGHAHYASGAGGHLDTMPVEARTSSRFGRRIHPVTGEKSFHEGMDLAAVKGSPVSASGAGVVVRAGRAGSYGNLVVVDHGGGLETRYAHLDEIHVEVGHQLAAGDTLGTVGETGRATGPHLHFEVRRDGKALDPAKELGGSRKTHESSKDMDASVDR